MFLVRVSQKDLFMNLCRQRPNDVGVVVIILDVSYLWNAVVCHRQIF